VDLRGKQGELHKTLTVGTSRGPAVIPLRISIPTPAMSEERLRNQLTALADARAIFKEDCAKCHATPAAGRRGAELYHAACAICHEAVPRASSVPDLRTAGEGRSAAYWHQWIEEGRPGSVMPPFARKHGGILDEAQVRSLVEYLRERR
jgi:mono/diheme cytochrome c family protein